MKLCFIGAGKMAQEHAKAAVALGADIVSGYTNRKDSPNRQALEAIVGHNIEWFSVDADDKTDDRAMNDAANMADALVVAGPWSNMPRLARWAAFRGNPVLLEKPIVFTSDDRPVDHDYLRVGFNRRFYLPVIKLRDRIEQGGLISATLLRSEMRSHIAKRHGKMENVYLMSAFGIHMFDLLNYLFGQVGFDLKSNRDKTQFFIGELWTIDHIDQIPIQTTWQYDGSIGGTNLTCFFDDGTMWCLSPLEVLRVFDGVDETSSGIGGRIYKSREKKQYTVWTDSKYKPGVYEQMKAFLEGDSDIIATPQDAISALKLYEDIAQ